MTNKEWLDYLAHNAPDELAAWFDAEHVEHQERALDGDTDALEAKCSKLYDELDAAYAKNRSLREHIAKMQEGRNGWHIKGRELQKQVDNLAADLLKANKERERYRSKFGKCLDYADAIHALMDDEGLA